MRAAVSECQTHPAFLFNSPFRQSFLLELCPGLLRGSWTGTHSPASGENQSTNTFSDSLEGSPAAGSTLS